MSKKTKKALSMLLVVTLIAVIAIGGMLAYLTDRDSEANVFTVGDVAIDLNEVFDEKNAELIPGVRIEKEATITNTGKNDAWVWMTVAVPAVLDDENAELGSANVIHWNMPGCFWNGYHDDDKYIQSGIKDGYLPEGSTGVAAEDSWINDNVAAKETIDGVEYNVYTFKYVGAITPGETTNIGLSRVFMDENVDIDPDGQWYIVENGVTTKIDWNSNEDGAPTVYVSAYAIQKDTFADVEAAYKAYQTQWGENGSEYEDPATVKTFEELYEALEAGGEVILGADIKITPDTELPRGNYIAAIRKDVTLDLNGHDITFDIGADKADSSPRMFYVYDGDLTIKGEGTLSVTNDAAVAWVSSQGGNLYIEGGNYVSDNHLTGAPNDIFAIIYSSGGEVHVKGGTFTYGNMSGGTNGGFNVQDWWGHKITLYEGVLLSNEVYRQPQDTSALRIRLDEGCTLKEVVIDGVTWYEVVKE